MKIFELKEKKLSGLETWECLTCKHITVIPKSKKEEVVICLYCGEGELREEFKEGN